MGIVVGYDKYSYIVFFFYERKQILWKGVASKIIKKELKEMATISILVAVYNAEKYLHKCLKISTIADTSQYRNYMC